MTEVGLEQKAELIRKALTDILSGSSFGFYSISDTCIWGSPCHLFYG
jgi:hypothetical protein